MITAIYAWAKYIAEKDGINIDSGTFNKAVERVINNSYSKDDLKLIFQPISHLYEDSMDKIDVEKYKFKIIDQNGERELTKEELQKIMFPKKGLTGKAQQSIGGSIFARDALKSATIEAGGTYSKSDNTYQVTIPQSKLNNFWRRRLLDTYFRSGSSLLRHTPIICPFCGNYHNFKNARFNPPINIFIENVVNYNSYLFNEPSHSVCPYCNMLFMRTLLEEKGPEKITFSKNKNAFIYILPFDPENQIVYEDFSRKKAEKILEQQLRVIQPNKAKEDFDALKYLLMFPLIIYDMLPYSFSGKIKPFVYVVFAVRSKQAEEILNQFVITRFDYLGIVGRLIKEKGGITEVYNFRERLLSFADRFETKQRINGYKLIFNFVGKMLSIGEVDFTFLHRILRNEIALGKRKGKTLNLGGYNYLQAFLKSKKEV